MRRPRHRRAAHPASRGPATIGCPWGQVLASPIAASIRSSSTGDIACSRRSASSWTSSQGTPRTSVRKRSISRWRRTMPSACSAPAVGEGDRPVGAAGDVAVAFEAADHLVHRRGRELHRPGDVGAGHRQAGLLQPEEALQVLLLGDRGGIGAHALDARGPLTSCNCSYEHSRRLRSSRQRRSFAP